MFILATFADKGYWPSCLEPLLYPTDCSFYRPFSYREAYVSPSLLNVFNSDQLEKLLLTKSWNNGIFGIRFRDETQPEYRGKFIPLRLVTLTAVEVTDSLQVSFRLGEYVRLSEQLKLQPIILDGIVDYSKPEDTLMVEIPLDRVQVLSSLAHQPEFPMGLWDRLADDAALSEIARQNFMGTIVLRLKRVSERGETGGLTPTALQPKANDRAYGFVLRSGKVYDLDLAYQRIIAPGQPLPQIPYEFAFRSPFDHFNVSRDRLRITGNYRREVVWIQPRVGRPAPTVLEWVGVKSGEKDLIADPKKDKILPLQIPILSQDRFWTHGRTIDFIFTAILLAAAVASFYFAINTSLIPGVAGDLPQVQQRASDLSKILTAVGAACAGLFGAFLKDFMKGRS